MRNIVDVTTTEILEAIVAHNPNWLVETATAAQLRHCLGMDAAEMHAYLLQSRHGIAIIVSQIHSGIYRAMMHKVD